MSLPADQWMRLLGVPDLHVAGYDCEDSALLCLEILHLLKRTDFQDPILQQVQQMLRAYTACFVFGTLLINESTLRTPMPHFSQSTFSTDRRFSKQPFPSAIVFEGTARIGGSVERKHSRPRSVRRRKLRSAFASSARDCLKGEDFLASFAAPPPCKWCVGAGCLVKSSD